MRHSHATDLIYSLGWITLSFLLNAVQWNACSLQRGCMSYRRAMCSKRYKGAHRLPRWTIFNWRHQDGALRFWRKVPTREIPPNRSDQWSGGREGRFFHGHILKIEKRFKVYFIVSRATNKTPLSKKHSPAFEVVLTLQIGSCKWANCLSLGDNL